MKKGTCLVDGCVFMESTMRGPEHPQGPAMQVSYALAREVEGKVVTCGKVSLGSPPTFDSWPDAVRDKFLALVEALEEHFMETGELFEHKETLVHAIISDGPGEPGLPTEF